ncbi:hypothetical protein Trydic_g12020, partial [Trypoxylus dichotomus]
RTARYESRFVLDLVTTCVALHNLCIGEDVPLNVRYGGRQYSTR